MTYRELRLGGKRVFILDIGRTIKLSELNAGLAENSLRLASDEEMQKLEDKEITDEPILGGKLLPEMDEVGPEFQIYYRFRRPGVGLRIKYDTHFGNSYLFLATTFLVVPL